ncbi:hypothetical protein KBI33_03195 [Candidatus Shapirobacteria bacterium]|nr:hypothetical protein [Candidatus Shapirobacteria bacterium]
MKRIAFVFVSILSLIFLAPPALAQETNKFGIHILDPSEAKQAAELVNSSGGDWGFITIVIRDDDRNFQKWQNFFDQCRQLHLVPIVRIATHNENEVWVAPKKEEINSWANFLSNLNWPIKNRYVVIFNEPNHAKEWGGKIDPFYYAQILDEFISQLKKANPDFQVLPAGFDLAAPNSKTTKDTLAFWQEMNKEVPGIFEKIDGWASHSYPNHGFLGKPQDAGRASIRGYQWELSILKNQFGVKKDLPVFITETGWPHDSEKPNPPAGGKSSKYYKPEVIAQYFEEAYQNIWLPDKRVIAVTPFTLNYQATPLDIFSWFDHEGQPYPQYERVKKLPKISWWPEQEEKWEVMSIKSPQFMPISSNYQGKIILKNVGQSIWGEREPFVLKSRSPFSADIFSAHKIFPGQSVEIPFAIVSNAESATINISWEGMEETININVFNPAKIESYQDHFWQKMVSLLRIWWYDKKQ